MHCLKFMTIYLFIYLSIYCIYIPLPIYMCVCEYLCTCRYVCVTFLSFYCSLSIYVSVCPSIYIRSTYLVIYLSIYFFIYLFIYLSTDVCIFSIYTYNLHVPACICECNCVSFIFRAYNVYSFYVIWLPRSFRHNQALTRMTLICFKNKGTLWCFRSKNCAKFCEYLHR